jgi:hypothetical protein
MLNAGVDTKCRVRPIPSAQGTAWKRHVGRLPISRYYIRFSLVQNNLGLAHADVRRRAAIVLGHCEKTPGREEPGICCILR